MRIVIPKNLNAQDIMRRANYGSLRNGSFAKRLGNYDYPRFHVYTDRGIINLHLDQKKASYEGSSAHSGEYEGEIVEREIIRIEGVIKNLLASGDDFGQDSSSHEASAEPEKKGFWGSIFG